MGRTLRITGLILVAVVAQVAPADLQLSRPTSIVIPTDNHALAYVANKGTGTVSQVDLQSGKVTNQFSVGKTITDLVSWPETSFLLAVDHQARCLHLLRQRATSLAVEQTLPLSAAPLRISVSDDGTAACVTSEWATYVQFVELNTTKNESPGIRVALPTEVGFPQQEVVALRHQQFLVADRFRGRLAIVDAVSHDVLKTSELYGHNIRGLTVGPDGESVLVAHQILSRVARTTLEDIHWGMVMQNVVRRIPVTDLHGDLLSLNRGRLYRLGDTGNGFADPGSILVVEDGFLTLSAGSNQVMLTSWDGKQMARTTTGVRPVRLARVDHDAFAVINSLSDSVSVIEGLKGGSLKLRFENNSAPPANAAQAGEAAFYDAGLSHDGWMSCHSCHTDGHSPDLLADTRGDGTFGNPKRIPSLLGVGDTGPWGWNGGKTTLVEQVRQTLTSTMHHKAVTDETVAGLMAFLRTLPPAAAERRSEGVTAKGRKLFDSLGCIRCHVSGNWTSPDTYDVGLKDEAGTSKFNPPSLRGVGLRSRFFHDARADSLESVFRVHRHNLKEELDDEHLKTLVDFLRTL